MAEGGAEITALNEDEAAKLSLPRRNIPVSLLVKKGLSLLASASIIALLFLVIFYDSNVGLQNEDVVTVRKVDMQVPPPPPPPPPVEILEQSTPSASVDMFGGSSPAQMQFSAKPELKNIQVGKVEKPELEIDGAFWEKTLSVDFPEVDMKELDAKPTLVSSVKVRIPRELRKKGVRKVEVRVQVLIVETGKAYIRKLVDIAHPEMEETIRKYISRVRFTPPTKHGQPVHAVYYWTIRFVEAG